MSSMFGVGVASNYPTVSTTYGVDPHNSYYVLEQNTDASGTKIVGDLEVTGTILGDSTITAKGGFIAPEGAGGATPTSTALFSSELNFYDSAGGTNTQAFKLEYDGTPNTLNIVGVPSNDGLHIAADGKVTADQSITAPNLTLASTAGEYAIYPNNNPGYNNGLRVDYTPTAGSPSNLVGYDPSGNVWQMNSKLAMNNQTIGLGLSSGAVYYDAGGNQTVVADNAKIVNSVASNAQTTTLDSTGFTVNGGPVNANGGLSLPASSQIQFGAANTNYLTAGIGTSGLDAVFTNSFQIFAAAALGVPVGTFGPGGLSVGNGTSPTRGNLACGNMDCTGAPGNYNLDWSVQNPNSTPASAQMRFNAFGLQFHLGKTATSDTVVNFIQQYPAGTYPIVLVTSANYDGGAINQFSMATSVTNTGFTAHSTNTNQTGGNCSAYFLAIGPDPNA